MAPDEQPFVLDVDAFPAFRPLLEACKEYAALSGGRFLSGDFCCEDAGDGPGSRSEELHAASLSCKDCSFAFEVALKDAQTLREDQSDLLQEVRGAYRLAMSEAIRSGMKATLMQLELWPPTSHLFGDTTVDENDCAYEDMSEPLPVIAQRCFNDDQRRTRDPRFSEVHRRMVTASFLVDFAVAAGMELNTMPETQQIMLSDFTRQVEDWTDGQAGARSNARAALLNGLGLNKAADVARAKVTEWWADNWRSVAWTTAAVGAIAIGMAMAKRRR